LLGVGGVLAMLCTMLYKFRAEQFSLDNLVHSTDASLARINLDYSCSTINVMIFWRLVRKTKLKEQSWTKTTETGFTLDSCHFIQIRSGF